MTSNGAAIKAIRERSGLTCSELARTAQIDRTHLHRIESGERRGTQSQIVRLAEALKVPVTAIINSTPESGAA